MPALKRFVSTLMLFRKCMQSLIHSFFDMPLKHYNLLYHETRKEKTFCCKKHRMDRFDRFGSDRAYYHLADILS